MPTSKYAAKLAARGEPEEGGSFAAKRRAPSRLWLSLSERFPSLAAALAAERSLETVDEDGSAEAGFDLGDTEVQEKALSPVSGLEHGGERIYAMTVAWMDLGAEGSSSVVGSVNLKRIAHVEHCHFGNDSSEVFLYVKESLDEPAAVLVHGGDNGGVSVATFHVC